MRQPGPNRGLWPQPTSSALAQAPGDTQEGRGAPVGREAGLKRIDYPSKEKRAQSSL